MRGKKRRLLAFLTAAAMMLTQSGVLPAQADAVGTTNVVTLGADLDDAQKESIMQFFGVSEDEVEIITITNQDERDMLGLLLPSEQIGTHTYSCAMVSPTTRGGIQVKTANMNYVTSNMIAATLSTSGVVNCDVLTAAPFMVSGTGALTGTMMAYETAIGQSLDDAKKELANEELVTTEELADTVGQEEATLVVNDIKIHIIRDQVKDESEVREVVDDVVDTTYTAMTQRESDGGEQARAINSDQKDKLYSFGYKVSQQDYNYDEMKVTLQRVTENVVASTGLEDPITETFEDLSEESALAEDSILRDTDDEALGEDSNVNTTAHDAAEAESSSSVTLTESAVLAGGSLVEDSDVIFDGSAIYDMEGSVVVEYPYNRVASISGGYLSVWTDEGVGILSQDGTELIPAKYDAFGSYGSRYWQVGLYLAEASEDDYDVYALSVGSGYSYYQIVSADIYFIDDQSAALVGTVSRDDMQDFRCHNRFISIEDRSGSVTMYDETFAQVAAGLSSIYDTDSVAGASDSGYETGSVNGQAVLKDSEGNVVLSSGYQSIYDIAPDAVKVYDGTHYGLIDYEGNMILPCLYKKIVTNYYGPYDADEEYGYRANGYYAVVDDNDQICFAVTGGAVTCETGAADSVADVYGASALYQDNSGVYHIFAADGVETILPETYTYCYVVSGSSGVLYQCHDDDYNYEIIDWHGEVVCSGEYFDADISGSGEYFIVEDYYNDVTTVYRITYPEAPELEAVEDGRTTVELEQAQSIARAEGVTLTKIAEVEAAEHILYSNNLRIRGENYAYAIADVLGNVLTDYCYDYGALDYDDGLVVASNGDDTYAVYDASGEILTCEGDYVEILGEAWTASYVLEATDNEDEADFHNYTTDEDLTIVSAQIFYVGDGADGQSLQLDHETASSIKALDNDRVAVRSRAGLWSVYDKNFTLIVTDQADSYDADDNSGYHTFRDNGQQGIVDVDGNIVLPAMYKYVEMSYYDGKYVQVSDGEHEGLVDLEGHQVLPVIFDDVMRNYEAVVTNGKSAGFDNMGYFAVVSDGKFGYAAAGGEMTCETAYDASVLDVEGACAYYQNLDGSYTLIAADGVETQIEQDKMYALTRSCGLLWYSTDDNYERTLFDWHGSVLLEGYDDVDLSYNREYLYAEKDDVLEIYQVSFDGWTDGLANVEETEAENSQAAEGNEAVTEIETTVEMEAGTEAEAAEAEDHPAESAAKDGEAGTTASETETSAAQTERETAGAAETEQAAAETEAAQETTQPDTAEPDTAVTDTAAASASDTTDTSAVQGLLSSALILMDSDFEANAATIATLLTTAAGECRRGRCGGNCE